MQNERRFDGWKMALNITEFLFHTNLHEYLENLEKEQPDTNALWTRTFMMADRVEDRDKSVDSNLPLVIQRCHGLPAPGGWGRERLIHKHLDGQYYPGRHKSNHSGYNKEDLLLLWFAYSPFNCVKSRKLQIQHKLPQSDIDRGRSYHHIRTEEQLESEYLNIASQTTCLLNDPIYKQYYTKRLPITIDQ